MSATGQNIPNSQTVLYREIEEFLIDREARLLTPMTLRWYRDNLAILRDYLDAQGVTATAELTPAILRQYILHLSQRGHSHGGAATATAAWSTSSGLPGRTIFVSAKARKMLAKYFRNRPKRMIERYGSK